MRLSVGVLYQVTFVDQIIHRKYIRVKGRSVPRMNRKQLRFVSYSFFSYHPFLAQPFITVLI